MKNKWFYIFLALFAGVSAFRLWLDNKSESEFECRSRIQIQHLDTDDGVCINKTVSVLFSFGKSNKGYIYLSGTPSCPLAKNVTIDEAVKFTYAKQNKYLNIAFESENSLLKDLFGDMKNNQLNIKMTKMNSHDYVISSPARTFMMCTQD